MSNPVEWWHAIRKVLGPAFGGRVLLLGSVFLLGAFAFRPAPSPTQRKAVIVELFTSEGCSSCPPADELLAHLSEQESLNGATIIPLGFHVDYWNSLGWQDRFSSRSYTERQQQYARKLRLDGPYTPQMVVDGTHEFVGNISSRAQMNIAEAATRPQQANVQVSSGESGSLRVQARLLEPSASVDVMLAITEDKLTTKVRAGENDGRVLRHAAVVRDFRRVGRAEKGSFDKAVPIHLEKEWDPANLHVVVFIQAADQGLIEGAVSVPWNSLSGAH
ncbi:MAG TPA: DUF1223 domain-containing protein [Candidatus Solibacter sp.]|jgi:hypothetical protein|nr:DUF1223 domain-containing protein [Candidatus Solibacter sp.]